MGSVNHPPMARETFFDRHAVGALLLGLAAFALCPWKASPVAQLAADDSPAVADPNSESRRRPVALALVDDAKLLLVANRRGSISTVDTGTNAVVAEQAIGGLLSDLCTIGTEGTNLLATDEREHRLLLLRRNGTAISVAAELDVPDYPVSIRVADDGRVAFVASLWSRTLAVVGIDPPANERSQPALKLERTIALPFAPRMQVWHQASKRLIVADSFAGRIAVVDPAAGKVESLRAIPGHNIRGLALSPDGGTLYVSHQTLNRLARTTLEDVHWGTLLTNVLHALSMDSVLDPKADLLTESRTHRLGDVGRAAGDPAGVAVIGDGRLVVAFAGVGEVGLLKEGAPGQQRIAAGIRPTAVAFSPRRPNAAYVADTFGDAVHVIDLAGAAASVIISLGASRAPTLAEQGEILFHDARLSHDDWMSCHSCHTDGHSNGLLNDNLGDGSFDAPKRVLSLLGLADTAPFAWNGGIADLETQIRKSVTTTMRGPGHVADLTDQQVAALAAYLKSLPPAPALGASSGPQRGTPAAAARGRLVFDRQNCGTCHIAPTYTSSEAYDVGFVDEVGNRKFNPPSLRGVSQRDALFHDNRATSLEDAFTRHHHRVPAEMPASDIADLVEFLRTL